MADSEKAAAIIVISGFVTGVGFRYYTERRARALGLTGYVRNLNDGDVEALAEGERAKIEELVAQLKQGPAGASVTEVKATWKLPSGRYSEFTIEASR